MKLYKRISPDAVAHYVARTISDLEAAGLPLASWTVMGFPNGDIAMTARAKSTLDCLCNRLADFQAASR